MLIYGIMRVLIVVANFRKWKYGLGNPIQQS
jgi:hypothetical protein